MPQQHLDRLTAVDASFLHQEGASSHMHVGAVLVFEGPPPAYTDLLDHLRGRLHLVPRYRQKLTFPPLRDWAGRCGSTTRTSTSSTTCATPRCPRPGSEEQLRNAHGAHRLPAARPLEAAVGDLARRRASRATASR